MNEAPLCIGMDVGGTRARLLARRGESPAWTAEGPGANLQRHGLDVTADRILTLLSQALAHAPAGSSLLLCAGVAGAGRKDDCRRLQERLVERLAPLVLASFDVVPDAWIAHAGAFDGESGMLVIAGTGSIVLARDRNGVFHRAGGWGYLLGDEGSGYALGLAGLRAVMQALEGGPTTQLVDLLAQRHGIDTPEALITCVYRDAWPVPAFAPDVLDAATDGDPVARTIVESQAAQLARQAARLAQRIPDLRPALSLTGGLSGNPLYHRLLLEALIEALPAWVYQPPLAPPVAGALTMACSAQARR